MPTAEARIEHEIDRLVTASLKQQAIANFADRLQDLLQVVVAHQAHGGTGPGKRVGLEAVNRAALVMLTGHFQGFVTELFLESWSRKYPGSDIDALMTRIRFNNPWPSDIDALYELVGVSEITQKAEKRPTASKAGPPRSVKAPHFSRARSQHQVRQVVAELVAIRNRVVHGGRDVTIRMSDVTSYLADCVTLSIRMSALT